MRAGRTGASARSRRALPRRGEALLERAGQVHHPLRLRSFGHLDGLTLRLLPDEGLHACAVLVLELRRLELAAHRADQLLGHLELLASHGRPGNLGSLTYLVRPDEGREAPEVPRTTVGLSLI